MHDNVITDEDEIGRKNKHAWRRARQDVLNTINFNWHIYARQEDTRRSVNVSLHGRRVTSGDSGGDAEEAHGRGIRKRTKSPTPPGVGKGGEGRRWGWGTIRGYNRRIKIHQNST